MLLGKFFYILDTEQTENNYKVKIGFNAAHEIFNGHFPDMPVVPGVCQVQVLKETISNLLGRDWFISTASSIKFLAVIEPLKTKELTMHIKVTNQETDKLSVSAEYQNEQDTFFRFKGELSAG
jgi:3-hydroxyacyl-[acyl-carrier-protein] dehydratase